MKVKFKLVNGRLLLNGKRYQEMNYTERSLFGMLINYKKEQQQEEKKPLFSCVSK
jgi:hypothetical protein